MTARNFPSTYRRIWPAFSAGSCQLLLLLLAGTCGCTHFSARRTDQVLLLEDRTARLRDVWTVQFQDALGTDERQVITNDDLARASQRRLKELFDASLGGSISPSALHDRVTRISP